MLKSLVRYVECVIAKTSYGVCSSLPRSLIAESEFDTGV